MYDTEEFVSSCTLSHRAEITFGGTTPAVLESYCGIVVRTCCVGPESLRKKHGASTVSLCSISLLGPEGWNENPCVSGLEWNDYIEGLSKTNRKLGKGVERHEKGILGTFCDM